MKAITFLNQIYKTDKMIENKLAEVEKLKSIATGMGGADNEKVKPSGKSDKIADLVSRYVDLEKEIEADIDKLIRLRKDVISVIERLKPDEYDLLHKVYVQNLTLGEAAYQMERSYSWATTTHKRAKAKVQKILDERSIYWLN